MTTNLYFDNTKIESWMTCPRKYFFRHFLHWAPRHTPTYFAFGSAWHTAMDAIWSCANIDLTSPQLALVGFEKFCEKWEAEAPEGWENDIVDIRKPTLAKDLLFQYVLARHNTLRNYELLGVEQPFAVPLNLGNVFYIGRLDKIYKDHGEIFVVDHKTTTSYKKEGGFRSDFVNGFSPNNQVEGYIYQGKIMYGLKFHGVMIDATLVHKTARAFKFIPISKGDQSTEEWIWAVEYMINEILDNTLAAEKAKERDLEYLPAFPKRSVACGSYAGCEYLDVCKYGTQNPLMMDLPDEFTVDPWEPFEVLGLEEETLTTKKEN